MTGARIPKKTNSGYSVIENLKKKMRRRA